MWTWGATPWRIRRRCLNRLVPDTSFLVALLDRRDALHPVAVEIERVLREAGVEYVYLDCVVNEVLAVVERRAWERRRRQEDVAEMMERVLRRYPAELITWVYPEAPGWWDRCVETMRASGWRLSFHDALMAVACRELGLGGVVSFDRDLAGVEGLEVIGSVQEAEGWVRRRGDSRRTGVVSRS